MTENDIFLVAFDVLRKILDFIFVKNRYFPYLEKYQFPAKTKPTFFKNISKTTRKCSFHCHLTARIKGNTYQNNILVTLYTCHTCKGVK